MKRFLAWAGGALAAVLVLVGLGFLLGKSKRRLVPVVDLRPVEKAEAAARDARLAGEMKALDVRLEGELRAIDERAKAEAKRLADPAHADELDRRFLALTE